MDKIYRFPALRARKSSRRASPKTEDMTRASSHMYQSIPAMPTQYQCTSPVSSNALVTLHISSSDQSHGPGANNRQTVGYIPT